MAYTTTTIPFLQTIDRTHVTTMLAHPLWKREAITHGTESLTRAPETSVVGVTSVVDAKSIVAVTLRTLTSGLGGVSYTGVAPQHAPGKEEDEDAEEDEGAEEDEDTEENDDTVPTQNPPLHSAMLISTPPSPSSGTTLTPSPTDPLPTLVTKTQILTHPLCTSTQITIAHQWPRVGSVPSEDDILPQWRETFDARARRARWLVFGALCAVFVAGVVGVLALGVWRCCKEGTWSLSRKNVSVSVDKGKAKEEGMEIGRV